MEKIQDQLKGNKHTIHGLNFYLSFFDDIAKLIPRDEYCFIVGGWVRDRILGIPVGKKVDVDIVVTSNPEEVGRKFAEAIGGKFFVFEKKGIIIKRPVICTVILEIDDYRYRFDFSQIKGKDVEKALIEDLKDRDFTANAMAVSIDDVLSIGAKQTIIYDPTGGIRDLEKGILRPISLENLKKDPIRLIRGFRIAGETDLELSEDFRKFVKEHGEIIRESPEDKITFEFLKILSIKTSAKVLRLMYELGFLEKIFPEIGKLRHVSDQGENHIYPLDEHTFKTVDMLEFILNNRKYIKEYIFEKIGNIKFLGEFSDIEALKLSALFHDIGKPDTFKKINGKITFYEHDKLGSEMVKKIGSRWRWGEDLTRFVSSLVRHHLRLFYLREADTKGTLTSRGILKFWRDCGDIAYHLFILSVADALASGDKKEEMDKLIDTMDKLEAFKSKEMARTSGKTLLNGREIMKICGLEEGPLVGKIKRMLEEAQVEGIVKTKEEAIEFIKKKIKEVSL